MTHYLSVIKNKWLYDYTKVLQNNTSIKHHLWDVNNISTVYIVVNTSVEFSS